MFPLGILTYVKIGLCAALLFLAGYIGFSLEAARFDRYKAAQQAATQKAQEERPKVFTYLAQECEVLVPELIYKMKI